MADTFDTKHDRDAPQAPREIDLDAGRRAFFRTSGLAVASASLLGTGALMGGTTQASAADAPPTDVQILNFALNLEYLEAEFYQQAAFGTYLSPADTGGTVGNPGTVTGGRKVQFTDPLVSAYAQEIANDELTHVRFLRTALGSAAVREPSINIGRAFHDAAVAANIIPADGHFNAYDNDITFLLAAYIFEDVGVTAYHGAAALITDKSILTAAAGILAVEAYHAGIIRTSLFAAQTRNPENAIFKTTRLISELRNTLAHAGALSTLSPNPDDQGISANESQLSGGARTPANLVPTDANGLAFARTPAQVLNIVYGGQPQGLFFPNGINAGNAS